MGEEKKEAKLIEVEALRLGYDGEKRRKEGDRFIISEDKFSDKWMKRTDDEEAPQPKESKRPAPATAPKHETFGKKASHEVI